MDKSVNSILKVCAFVFLISGLFGLYFLSVGQDTKALTSAKIGGLFSILFTAIVCIEVITSSNVRTLKKLIWIVAFLMFQILAGVVYCLIDRKVMSQRLVLN